MTRRHLPIIRSSKAIPEAKAEDIRQIYEKIRDFCLTALFGVIGAIVFGLLMTIGVVFLRHHPIWALLVAGLFGIFHLDDLTRFFRERNWLALLLRPVAILIISAPVSGMIWLALRTHEDPSDKWIALAVVSVFSPLVVFYVFLNKYFSESRLHRSIENIIDGIRVTGVF